MDAQWLSNAGLLDNLRIIDARPAFSYRASHIPDSVNLSAALLMTPTGDPIAPDTFARLMGRIGVKPGDEIVVVDENGTQAASLLLWVLHLYGLDRVHLLDGGFQGWVSEGFPTSNEPAVVDPVEYPVPVPREEVLASVLDAVAAGHDATSTLVDARSGDEFSGKDVHGVRGGHIPGAVHVEWSSNFDREASQTRRLDAENVRRIYGSVVADDSAEVVVYCHAGPRAAVTYVSLIDAGFNHVRLYPNGWGEYSTHMDLPAEL